MKKQMNGSLFAMLEQINRSCNLVEVSQITSLLVSYQHYGGAHLIHALRESVRELWQRRKNQALKQGEEASTKLLIPMIMMLIALLIVIATPAMLVFK
jgi:tight adherence protein C